MKTIPKITPNNGVTIPQLGFGTLSVQQDHTFSAENTATTAGAVALPFEFDYRRIVFPKTFHRERMQENLDLFDFDLSPDKVTAIDALNQGESGRIGPRPDTFDWIRSVSNTTPGVRP
jgi:diketogulonate reductase-like aldo/keto reductase